VPCLPARAGGSASARDHPARSPAALSPPPASPARRGRRKIIYAVTEDWYFCSHRLPMALAAQALGCEVIVATRVDRHGEIIRGHGFRLVDWKLDRRSTHPGREGRALAQLVALYRRERPDLVHHVAMKPVVYGAIAARLAGVPAVLNALAGLGAAFIANSRLAQQRRRALLALFRRLLDRPGSRLLVQNEDDRALFLEQEIVAAERVALIPGSGVDTERFRPSPEPAGVPVAVLAGRMLWDKGVGEAVEAARLLAARGVALRIALVGRPDPANPRSIAEATLRGWVAEGLVEWWGQRDDMVEVWRDAAIGLLPSYREGMPKSLLEAAACGRPLVATDVPGCRALVTPGVDGLLVPPRDPAALAAALETLARDPLQRRRLGAAARESIAARFSDAEIRRQIADLYREMLALA
jgi:glycosyltransferase involved in cell wall biosynthesis